MYADMPMTGGIRAGSGGFNPALTDDDRHVDAVDLNGMFAEVSPRPFSVAGPHADLYRARNVPITYQLDEKRKLMPLQEVPCCGNVQAAHRVIVAADADLGLCANFRSHRR
jgi:hypothetical protein